MVASNKKQVLYVSLLVLILSAVMLNKDDLVRVGNSVIALDIKTSIENVTDRFGTKLKAYNNRNSGMVGGYLSARYAFVNNDLNMATGYFESITKFSKNNKLLNQQLLQSYLLSGDYDKSFGMAKTIVDNGKNSQLAIMIAMAHDFKNKNYKESLRYLEKIPPYGLMSITNPIIYKWIDFIDSDIKIPKIKMSNKRASDFFAIFNNYQTALIYDMKSDKKKANKFYQSAFRSMSIIYPNVVMSYLDFVRRSKGAQHIKAAYNDLLRINKFKNLINYIGDVEEVEEYLGSLGSGRLVSTPQYAVSELFFMMSRVLYQDEMSVEALVYLRIALLLDEDNKEALLFMASILADEGKYDSAKGIFNYIGKLETPNYVHRKAKRGLSYCFNAEGEVEESRRVLQDLLDEYPNNQSILLAIGDSYRNGDNYKKAIEFYSRILLNKSEESEDDWAIYYSRAISYDQSNQWEAAEKDLQKALKLSPSQPEVENYLAYSWTDKGINLEKARVMLEVAMEKRPNNANIIDSVGWVYFMLGEYEKSVFYLEQALDLMPADPTVNEHLGDALWKYGRKNEARFSWHKALQFKPEKLADSNRIMKKLESGYIAPESNYKSIIVKKDKVDSLSMIDKN